MAHPSPASQELALRDFQHARQQAVMQQLLARFRGEDANLLPFSEIEEQLQPTGEKIAHGTQEIPLNKIVGSVSRYRDFTSSFLPKRDSDRERWTGVRAAVQDMTGIPPIEVYQLGDAYFVQDGNHRVSIARSLNSETITARVIEVKTRVSFAADDDPNEFICKANYARFLEQTNLDRLRPDVDLSTTFCGQYPIFLNQIAVCTQMLAGDQLKLGEAEIDQQGVLDWYDHTYLPVINIIRELGILHYFPERTEADIYLLLSERHAQLEHDLGWQVDLESGVAALVTVPEEPRGLLKRLVGTIAPAKTLAQPPGLWRQQQLARRRHHHLFKDMLVELDGTEENWQLIDHFIRVGHFEEDHILGLHIVPDESTLNETNVRAMKERFLDLIRTRNLRGEFAVEVSGNPVAVINKRAAWVDLVVVRGTRLPNNQPLTQASAELKALVEGCPRPIHLIPDGTHSDNSRAILAYDGSPKANEALFIATYLTAKWSKKLTVVTVETAYTSPVALEQARSYLHSHGVTNARYVLKQGPIADMVLEAAAENECNVLFMGGFSFRSLRQLNLGSSAERIILEFPHPMWICR